MFTRVLQRVLQAAEVTKPWGKAVIHLALALFIPSVVCLALTIVSYATRLPDAGTSLAWASLIAVGCSGVLLELVREWRL